MDAEAAEHTVSPIGEQGGKAISVRADMSKVSEIESMIAQAVARYGRLDILVNNAGIYPMKPAQAITEALWDRVLDINLKGTFFAAQAAAKHMITAG
ncbi:MAG TPA: SDR family NAD(P)-dependent oxidoreductase, partial [Ktedonobacterales bacterium]|nr:SDR family NAD(P)-dependent oxidoreductase [Ktedonobacterales bacterium]